MPLHTIVAAFALDQFKVTISLVLLGLLLHELFNAAVVSALNNGFGAVFDVCLQVFVIHYLIAALVRTFYFTHAAL